MEHGEWNERCATLGVRSCAKRGQPQRGVPNACRAVESNSRVVYPVPKLPPDWFLSFPYWSLGTRVRLELGNVVLARLLEPLAKMLVHEVIVGQVRVGCVNAVGFALPG